MPRLQAAHLLAIACWHGRHRDFPLPYGAALVRPNTSKLSGRGAGTSNKASHAQSHRPSHGHGPSLPFLWV